MTCNLTIDHRVKNKIVLNAERKINIHQNNRLISKYNTIFILYLYIHGDQTEF